MWRNTEAVLFEFSIPAPSSFGYGSGRLGTQNPCNITKGMGPCCGVIHYRKNIFLRPDPAEPVALGG